MRVFIFSALLLCFCGYAQVSGTNLVEYQFGKLPNANENSFHGVYSKPVIHYRLNKFKATAWLQFYQSPFSERNYTDLSWLGLNYKNKGWDISLGNFNSTLERGILFRSYEIQGALLEDLSYRGKYYFYRDVLGASVGFKRKKFSVRAIWGHTLNNVFPPSRAFEDRRTDEIFAVTTSLKMHGQSIGISAIRIKNEVENSYYGASHLSGNITSSLAYYISYAKNLNDPAASRDSYALYGSLNYALKSFGLSAEWKNYENFVLGSGINEPPALVKEHSYRVLNRITHVLDPGSEKGVQLEAYYAPNNNTAVNLNYTYASNNLGKLFNYEEWFAQFTSVIFNKTDLRVFVDYAKDELKGQSNRGSTGFFVNHPLSSIVENVTFEFNAQTFKRNNSTVKNYVGDVTLRFKSKLFLSVLSEWSNDRTLSNNSKLWLGSTVNYKWNNKNTFTLFVGERRGGPACNAGVCYEILDFKGVEFRWVSRL